jgi:hypothetical protein
MKLTQVCEGCGEEFITHHDTFCSDCSVVRIEKIKALTIILKQPNERNRESKLRDRRKRQRKPFNAKISTALS